VISYHLIKEKTAFVELGANHVDEKKREAQLKYYQKRIEELGAEIPETKST
jgi:prefoldin subunit 5